MSLLSLLWDDNVYSTSPFIPLTDKLLHVHVMKLICISHTYSAHIPHAYIYRLVPHAYIYRLVPQLPLQVKYTQFQ